MQSRLPPATEFLLHWASGKGQPGLVEERAKLVRAGNPDQYRSSIRHVAKAPFAFLQRGGAPAGPAALHEQRSNQDRLKHQDQAHRDHAPLVLLPEGQHAETNDTARR